MLHTYIHSYPTLLEVLSSLNSSGSRTCPGAGCYGAVYRGELKDPHHRGRQVHDPV